MPTIRGTWEGQPVCPRWSFRLALLEERANNFLSGVGLLVETMLRKQRLALIWANLFGRKKVRLDDTFFHVGGNPELFAARPVQEGVHAPRSNGNCNRIFWVHYVSWSLAKVLRLEHPFLFVVLTAEDFASLGAAPTLQSIAACLLRKILATQPKGPFTLVGFCAGGVLAYEIASQLQAAGHEVSLLVLLDAPNLAYIKSHDSLTNKLSYPRYALKRVVRLGPRRSFAYFREHLFKGVEATPTSAGSEIAVAQKMVGTAVRAYQPKKYEGKVLLLMASDRAPHLDLSPGWQSVVAPQKLHIQYLDGHRSDLLKVLNVRRVVDAILSHL